MLKDGYSVNPAACSVSWKIQEKEITTMTVELAKPVPATDDQKKQARRLMEEAIDGVLKDIGFDKAAMRRLIERGPDVLRFQLIGLLRGLVLRDEFADEEVPSEYGYLSGYKPRPIAEQMSVLQGLFPQLKSFDTGAANRELTPGAEGAFLIPRWQAIASTYGRAVKIILTKLKKADENRFYDHHKGKLGRRYLRQKAKKRAFFQVLGDEQKGHDVLLVHAQFGLRHRGRSMRRVCFVTDSEECGLGAFEVGIMLLTHPDRLMHPDDLCIDCAGDEYASAGNGLFVCAPYFGSYPKERFFGVRTIDRSEPRCGLASAFATSVPSQ